VTPLPWWPVVGSDVVGSTAAFVLAALCVKRSWRWARAAADDVFRHYVFLLTLTIAVFAISRSVGHLVKQILLALEHGALWEAIAPYSGATNSAAFIAVFAFCLLFGRIRRIRIRVEQATLEATAAAARAEQAELDLRGLATIFDGLNAFVYVSDADHKIRFLNRKTRELLPHIEVGSLGCEILCAEEVPCDRCDCDRVLGRGETVVREMTLASAERVVQLTEIPLQWVDGEAVKLNVAADVTETRRMEMQLARAQKMEALGTLAGGVAHDLNNVLSGIVGYPDLLLQGLPEESPLVRPLQAIRRSGEKAASIVQDLLTLARRGVAVPQVVDLNDMVRAYLKTPEFEGLQRDHPDVQVTTRLTGDELPVLGSAVHLGKTVMNLVANAAEAMPDGGAVTLSTERRTVDRPIGGAADVRTGDYAVLTVADAGEGIPSEDRERIFEPFFTKKKMGRSGTGLGMTVVWGTVQDHDGYIDVHSEVGRGTTFSLYFPVSREARSVEASVPGLECYPGQGERVLVVDDLPEQRDLARTMLRQQGYEVAVADGGEAAVRHARAHPVDLAVLDMIMDPGIDGLETYRRLRQIQPGIRAVIASGFSETARVREAQRLGAGAYLKKPYSQLQLAEAVFSELHRE
jgi:signal transduction histidine kinase